MSPNVSGGDTRTTLEALVRNYDRDAVTNGRRIRELLEQDRDTFYNCAIDILRSPDQCRGFQYLITTLLGNDLLIRALTDPALSQEQAMALARASVSMSSMVDVTLARHLSESLAVGGKPAGDVTRLMAILSEISSGNRILPTLMSLARQQNKHLQSKAVLMIGRANHSVKWVQTRLSDPDSRVRANAVEALWGVDSEEARTLMHTAARDENNRVVGNALLGLYRLGDTSCIPALLQLAEHESRLFRVTAAWTMGETGDPRFTKALGKLMREPHGDIRARAFEALGQIRAATALAGQGGEWRVVGRFNRSLQSGWRRLQVQVSSQDGKEQIQLVPTQFILTEDAQNVVSYSVEERQVPDFLSLAFLFPRPADPKTAPFNQGVLSALRWKRPSDLWSALQFIPKAKELEASLAGQKIAMAPAEPRLEEDLPLQFTCDPETARAAFLKLAPKLECTDLWGAIRRAVQLKNGPVRGKRQVIIYSQHESASASGYAETASAAKTAHTVVSAFSLVPNAMLENLCQLTKGHFQIIDAEDEAGAAVEQLCLNLMARYTIRYQPADPRAASLAIRAQSPAGWGEATLPIPPQAG